MSLSKKMMIDSMRSHLTQTRLFEEANLSFLLNMRSMEDVKNAYMKSFNLLAKKQVTPSMLKELFVPLEQFSRLIEKMEIDTVLGSIVDLKENAKEICATYSLPTNVKEEKVNENEQIDLSFYKKALDVND